MQTLGTSPEGWVKRMGCIVYEKSIIFCITF